MYVFETVELELGLSVNDKEVNSCCPIFLHKDESNVSRYFATHQTGVHCVTLPAVEDLQKFVGSKDGKAELHNLLYLQ